MKLKISTLALLLFAFYTTQCLAQEGSKAIKQRNTAKFQKLVDKPEKLQFLDVRTAQEYAESHIEGAENINVLEEEAFLEGIKNLNKKKKIAVYCRSGKRSMKAAKILEEQGFKKIYNLEGGILQWKEDELPTVE